jgi:hypothetical protein
MDVNIRSRGQLKLLVSADVIGMQMGVKYVSDLHAHLPGNGEIILYVPFGIHNGHGLGPGAADDIGKATHAVNRNLIEIHKLLLYPKFRGPVR